MDSKKLQNMVSRVTFDQFRKMAEDTRLSVHEKIGFPDNYRDEIHTASIFKDIQNKLFGELGGAKHVSQI